MVGQRLALASSALETRSCPSTTLALWGCHSPPVRESLRYGDTDDVKMGEETEIMKHYNLTVFKRIVSVKIKSFCMFACFSLC